MILMWDTQVNYENIRNDVLGAGIIPVSVNPDGEIVLLLGKERHVLHWKGSLKWSGFEGGRKLHEDVEHAAAREFVEESLGVAPLNGDTAVAAIAEQLRRGEYVARITLCIVNGSAETHARRYHVTYLAETPYNPEIGVSFQCRRQLLLDAYQRGNELANATAPPAAAQAAACLLYTSPSPRDGLLSRMPSSA